MTKQVDNVNQKVDPTTLELLESLQAVMHVLRTQRKRVLQTSAHDLAPMEGKALGFFVRHPGATQSDLVAHSGRDKAQIARLIAKLRERGLLDITADAADRRSLRVAPTPEARALYQAVEQETQRLVQLAITGFSEQECEQLGSLLERMRRNLGEQ